MKPFVALFSVGAATMASDTELSLRIVSSEVPRKKQPLTAAPLLASTHDATAACRDASLSPRICAF